MISDAQLSRICVLMLTMPHEIDVTLKALDSVLFAAPDDVSILVLLNGGSSDSLRARLETHAAIEYFESDRNLGVAGGRAFLADQDSARGAEIIALLDNDLIVTTDYLTKIRNFLSSRPDAGIVGASVLNFRAVLPHVASHSPRRVGPLGEDLPRVNCDAMRKYVEHHHNRSTFFHIGTHPDWVDAYFPCPDPIGDFHRWQAGVESSPGHMRADDPAARELYRPNGPSTIEVSNIAGCTQAFRRSLYDELGGIRSKYSPYGFEDVDFALRAIEAGYHNFTLTRAFCLHGTDDRHQNRTELKGLWRATTVERRAYGLLFRDHCPRNRRWTIWANLGLKTGIGLGLIFFRAIRQFVALVLVTGGTFYGYGKAYSYRREPKANRDCQNNPR